MLSRSDPAWRPTNDDIAEAAWRAMHRPSVAATTVERLLPLTPLAREEEWNALDLDLKRECTAYLQTRGNMQLAYQDQAASIHAREECLIWLRRDDPDASSAVKTAWVRRYYANHLADFIDDWGYTIDPRLLGDGKNAVMAFKLFPKQRELIDWMLECWTGQKPGVLVKSRDVGASWVAMALAASLCIFRKNFAAGVASATELKLDRSGDPDTLFYKVRMFLEHLPPEFNGGFSLDHSAYLRIVFPGTGSSITGEAGDQAGRGGRKSLYFVDEAAHFEHPKLIDRNLSANTFCRIDMSSVNGTANSFYTRSRNKHIKQFRFTWRSDPRKNDGKLDELGRTWYQKMCDELDPITVAQELDCDFNAGVVGSIIPPHWVAAMVGLNEFLGIERSGGLRAALDVADEGEDKLAAILVEGNEAYYAESWSGKGSDVGYSCEKMFGICESNGHRNFDYDADGMGGASVSSAARMINEQRIKNQGKHSNTTDYFEAGAIGVNAYRGSEGVVKPEETVPRTQRKAKDFFLNRKSQSWWTVRLRAYESWKARNGKPYILDQTISIRSDLPELDDLVIELSQPTSVVTATGKIQVDKTPDGSASPNLADAFVIAFAPPKSNMRNMSALLAAAGGQG